MPPAADGAVAHGNVLNRVGKINGNIGARPALQGKAIQVKRDIVRGDLNPVLAAEAGDVIRQIIRAWLADDV